MSDHLLHVLANVANFLVLVGLIVKMGKKGTMAFLADRRKRIADAIVEGERLEAAARVRLAEWETKWKSSEAHAKRAEEDARTVVQRNREKAVAAARAESERIAHDAKLLAQSEQAKSKRYLGRELAEKSIRAAQQYLKSHLDDGESHRLVGDYVERLEKVHGGAR